MEALSVDIGRLKSGEVNLGVRFPDIIKRVEMLIGKSVHYLDIDYGRPIQGRSRHRRRQSDDHWCLYRAFHSTRFPSPQLKGIYRGSRPIV